MVAPPLLILATGAFPTGELAFRGASFTALWVGGASLAAASVTHSAARLVQRGIVLCYKWYCAARGQGLLRDSYSGVNCVVYNETACYFLVEAKSTCWLVSYDR